jgi:hypothetical protein
VIEPKTVFTARQVFWGSVLLIVLFWNFFPMFTGLSEHGFLFADPCLQRVSMVAVSLLPTALLSLIYFGPHIFGRTCILWVLVPVHVLVVGLIMIAGVWSGGMLLFMAYCYFMPERSVCGRSTELGSITVRLIGIETNTAKADHQDYNSLYIERHVLAKTFIEYKALISVFPSVGHFEVIDSGRKFKYLDSTGDREIVRVYNADWDSNVGKHCRNSA